MRRLILIPLLLVLAAPAQASFPGRNGDFVLSVDDGTCELASNLYRVTAKGAISRITNVCATPDDEARLHSVGEPEAAPDGASLLAYSNTVPSGVIALDADGSDVREVPVPAGAELSYDAVGSSSGLSLFPDGASFAAAGERYADGRNQVPVSRHFLDGAEPRALLPVRVQARNPKVSPDGRLLAVQVSSGKRPGLWLYSVRTGKAVRRVGPAKAVDVDWSPDSRRLVYATRYQQREVQGGAAGGNLFVVGRNGKGRRTLVHREDVAETEPTWSPDGRTVAFVSLGFSAGDVGFRVFPSLWKVSVRTGKRTRIRGLDRPSVEEGYFHAPELTWLPRP